MVFELFKAYFFSKKTGSSVKIMSWLSLIGTAIGVFGLVMVLSVMSGFNENIKDRLLAYEPHLVVYTNKDQKVELEDLLSSEYKILDVLDFESKDVIIRTPNGLFQGASARGLSKERMQTLVRENLDLALGEDQVKDNEVIMNFELARTLGALEGDYVDLIPPEALLKSFDANLKLTKVKLVGTFFSQLSDSKDSKLMIYLLNANVRPDSKNIKRGYEILLSNPMQSTSAKNFLAKNGFKDSQTWQERNSSLLLALKLEKLAMTIFLGLSALITSFSMMTVLLLLIHKKRQDMGILMSMGMSKAKIRFVFGLIGLLLSFTGVFLGLAPGLLCSWFIEQHPLQIMPSIYQDPYLPAHFDMWLVLSVVLFCLLICILSFIVPIIRISNLTPTKALRAVVSE